MTTTKVEICERAALDAEMIPVLQAQERFIARSDSACDCGETHMTPGSRVLAARLMNTTIRARETEIRALRSQLELVKEKA